MPSAELPLRDEEPPDDAVIVVRGGLLGRESLLRTAAISLQRHGFYGLSVYAAIDMSVEELVAVVPELSRQRYRQLRTTTVGIVRRAGFALLPTHAHPHFDIELPDLEAATLDRLMACFGPPFPNPGS